MSHLKRGIHTVTVTPISTTNGPYGPEEPADPVTITCNVQPVSSTERQALGLETSTVYRIRYFPSAHGQAPWPGGPYSLIEWQGRTYHQKGEALTSTMSPRTASVKILMVTQETEVK